MSFQNSLYFYNENLINNDYPLQNQSQIQTPLMNNQYMNYQVEPSNYYMSLPMSIPTNPDLSIYTLLNSNYPINFGNISTEFSPEISSQLSQSPDFHQTYYPHQEPNFQYISLNNNQEWSTQYDSYNSNSVKENDMMLNFMPTEKSNYDLPQVPPPTSSTTNNTPSPKASTKDLPKPYACDMCDRSFLRNHDLTRHKKIHGGIRKFECLSCSKRFYRKDLWRRHIMTKKCRDGNLCNNGL